MSDNTNLGKLIKCMSMIRWMDMKKLGGLPPGAPIEGIFHIINLLQDYNWDEEAVAERIEPGYAEVDFDIISVANSVGGYKNWSDDIAETYNLFFDENGKEVQTPEPGNENKNLGKVIKFLGMTHPKNKLITMKQLLETTLALHRNNWDVEETIKATGKKTLRSRFNVVALADAMDGLNTYDEDKAGNVCDAKATFYYLFKDQEVDKKQAPAP